MRTIAEWTSLINNKTWPELADFVLSDLTGYDRKSSWKEEDKASLVVLFIAIFEYLYLESK